jgi:hypothetical protein
MSHGVHADVQAMDAPGAQAPLDGRAAKAELQQLRMRHDPVLPLRDPGDLQVRWAV